MTRRFGGDRPTLDRVARVSGDRSRARRSASTHCCKVISRTAGADVPHPPPGRPDLACRGRFPPVTPARGLFSRYLVSLRLLVYMVVLAAGLARNYYLRYQRGSRKRGWLEAEATAASRSGGAPCAARRCALECTAHPAQSALPVQHAERRLDARRRGPARGAAHDRATQRAAAPHPRGRRAGDSPRSRARDASAVSRHHGGALSGQAGGVRSTPRRRSTTRSSRTSCSSRSSKTRFGTGSR